MGTYFGHQRNRRSSRLLRDLSGSGPNPLFVTITDPSPISLGDELLRGGRSLLPCSPSGTTPEGKAGVSLTVPCSGVQILLKAMTGTLIGHQECCCQSS